MTPKIIAIQGDEASFHHIAAMQFYGDDVEILPCNTFKDTFVAVYEGRASSAICAIENSLYGSINETYDLLLKHNFMITGEIYLRIEQCLIGFPDTKLEDIVEVYSHPVALAQCEEYLDMNLHDAERVEYHDTAASVGMIKSLGDHKIVAIAGSEAAKIHDMKVLAHSIETHKQNYTRFFVLEPVEVNSVANNKTSVIIETAHKPGALYDALGVFAKRSINLSKLMSRPIIGKAWHYMFYVDVDAGTCDKDLILAINELSEQDCRIKVLGSYQAGAKV